MEHGQLNRLLRQIRPFRHPSAGELRDFRAAIARLKQEGLISSRVNAAKAQPYTHVHGKSLRDILHSRDARLILEDKGTTIAASRVVDTQGYKVTKQGDTARVIVPLNKDARVSVENKNIVIRHPGTTAVIKRTKLPRKNLTQYLTDAEKLPELKGRKWYAFYAFNGKSKAVFRSPDLLREYLSKYRRISDSKKQEREFFRTFEIVEIEDRKTWEERSYQSGRHAPESNKRRRERYAQLPAWKKEEVRRKKREYMREYRRRK